MTDFRYDVDGPLHPVDEAVGLYDAAWEDAEFDTPEEVEAVFRAQRRLALRYAGLFFAVTLALPVVSFLEPAWTERPLLGGFTMAGLAMTVVYPLFCVLLGLSYALEASRMEESLLGRRFARSVAVPSREPLRRPGLAGGRPPGGRR